MMKAVSAALISLFVLTGCGDKGETNKEVRVIKVGSTGQSYPNGYKDNDKLIGFDVELTEAIAKELGLQIEWVLTGFSGLMGQLDADRIDTVANVVSATKARREKYNFTKAYSYYGSSIVTHIENTDINVLDDLHGKTISGVLGSNHLNVLKERFPNNEVNVRTYETRDGAMYDLVYKRVDGYINAKPILLAEIKRAKLPFKFVGDPLILEDIAYPFSKTKKGEQLLKDFDNALAKLRARGVIKELSVKYFGEDISEPY
jgi:putative amino-acid transport system substrate-binding protein